MCVEKHRLKLCSLSKLFDEKVMVEKIYSNVIGNLNLPRISNDFDGFRNLGLLHKNDNKICSQNDKKVI